MCVLEDNLMELVLFLHHVDGMGRTPFIGFGNVTESFRRTPPPQNNLSLSSILSAFLPPPLLFLHFLEVRMQCLWVFL